MPEFVIVFQLLSLATTLSQAWPIHESFSIRSPLSARDIWQPSTGSSWQIVLSKALEIDANNPSVTPDVDVLDIDMFLHLGTSTIPSLHQLNKKVVCYFSAGSYEPYRPDSTQFPQEAFGYELADWPGEYWIDVRNPTIRNIMTARIETASQMGCDAVDPDNVDAFDNDNGLNLTKSDSADFVKFLAAEAANRNMALGLKNALDVIPEVLPHVQFAVNEECAVMDECQRYASFFSAGKPVFHIEYSNSTSETVSAAGASKLTTTADKELSQPCVAFSKFAGLSTVVKTLALDGQVTYCDGQSYITKTL